MQLKLPLQHVRRKHHLANFMYEPAQIPTFVDNRNLLTRNGDNKLFKVKKRKDKESNSTQGIEFMEFTFLPASEG